MIKKKQYVEYLLSTPFNYTCTNLADHLDGVSHDVVNDFLQKERLVPRQLWELVRVYLVGNKLRGDEDEQFVRAAGDSLPVLGVFPYSLAAVHADQTGEALYDADAQAARLIAEMAVRLEAGLRGLLV